MIAMFHWLSAQFNLCCHNIYAQLKPVFPFKVGSFIFIENDIIF